MMDIGSLGAHQQMNMGGAAAHPPRNFGRIRAGLGGTDPRMGDMSMGYARQTQPMGQMQQAARVPQMSAIAQGAGVRPGMNTMGRPPVQAPTDPYGPSLQQIQAEMQRRQVGAQLGPRNGALAGYMMG